MSKNAKRIVDGLKKLNARAFEVVSGSVKSVDEAKATMVVELYDGGLEVEGVMLRAVEDELTGIVLIPEVGSDVVITSVDGPGEWMLVRASKLKKSIVTIGTTRLTMDEDGYEIKRGDETLAKLLDDTFAAIAQLTVTTGVGPSGTPINIATFQQIKQRAKTLLK